MTPAGGAWKTALMFWEPTDDRKGKPMTTPVTTLDQRFSDPAAGATGWDETRRVLETAELSWITTVRADGRPHVTPLVAVWADGALHFCTGAGHAPHQVPADRLAKWRGKFDHCIDSDFRGSCDRQRNKRAGVQIDSFNVWTHGSKGKTCKRGCRIFRRNCRLSRQQICAVGLRSRRRDLIEHAAMMVQLKH